jgi:hypothetical protein
LGISTQNSPIVECGRVFLVAGAWNDEFVEEIAGFPAKAHEEYVDLLAYAIDYHLKGKKQANLARLARAAGGVLTCTTQIFLYICKMKVH